MPAPLFATHPIEGGGALALVLAADGKQGPALTVRLARRAAIDVSSGDAAADPLRELRRIHPIGPALPMLAHLAAATSGWSSMAFDRYHSLEVGVDCNCCSD